jgi:hypothetical protein
MKKYLLLLLMGVSVNTLADDSLITPGDMPEEAQNTMFNISMDYNKCMMQSRLEASTQQRAVQEAADGILQKCETHLDDMKALLSSNHVNEELVVGMTKKCARVQQENS